MMLRANTDDWQPWPGYVPPDRASSISKARCERGRGNALPALLTAADRVYVAQHLELIAHLEARLSERENTVSDLADECARLRKTLAQVFNSLPSSSPLLNDVREALRGSAT